MISGASTSVSSMYLRKVSNLRLVKGIPGAHQKENAALAVHLAKKFVSTKEPLLWDDNLGTLPQAVIAGLLRAKWPGRCQRVHDPLLPTLTWFLDGAHTGESLQCCMEWFASPEASLGEGSE